MRTIVEPQSQDTQCGFCSGRDITDQLFTLRQIFEKAWEIAKPIYTAFIDLDKAYVRVHRDLLWSILKEYEISDYLLAAIQSLYDDRKRHVRINDSKSGSFWVRVGFEKGYVLSPLLFIIFMDRISCRSTTPDRVEIENGRVESPLFANDVARLASSSARLQRVLDRLAIECTLAGM